MKKIFSFIILIIPSLNLASCGNNQPQDTENTQTGQVSTETTTTTIKTQEDKQKDTSTPKNENQESDFVLYDEYGQETKLKPLPEDEARKLFPNYYKDEK